MGQKLLQERDGEELDRAPIPPALQRWTGTLLSRATQKLRERFESRLEPLGIRPRHYGVLALLEDGPLTQIEIGRYLWVDRTTMVALVDDLERLGLVERERHPGDRRAYAVTPTPRGKATLQEATEILQLTEQECFAALSLSEQEQLRALLLKLI